MKSIMLLFVFPIIISQGIGATLLDSSLDSYNKSVYPGFILNVAGVSLDSSVAHSGSASIRVQCDGLTQSLFSTDPISIGNPTESPRRIVVSAWVKSQDIKITHHGGWSAGRFIIWAHNAKGEKIVTPDNNGFTHLGLGEMSGYFCGTFGWRKLSGNFIIPAGTAYVTIDAGLSYAKGTAWFDDFQVSEVPLKWSPKEESKAVVSIDLDKLHPKPIEGVGWNWTYVFDRDSEMRMPRKNIDQLLQYAKWDEQSFVRFGFLAQYCFKDDARLSPPVYDDSLEKSKYYQYILQGLQKLNINILACNWHYGNQTGPYPNPPYSAERFADSVAVVIKKWVVNQKITGIKYASLWNEPEWWYLGGHYPNDFTLYWKALDQELRDQEIRDRVGIVAADTTQGGSVAALAFPQLNKELKDIVDIYSAHDYFAAIEAPGEISNGGVMTQYLNGYRVASTALGSKPLFIGEFGNGLTGDDETYRGTVGSAELVVGGLNSGVLGFARWAYNYPVGSDIMAPGFCPFVSNNGDWEPYRPVYYGYAVITKAVHSGDRVAECKVMRGLDEHGCKRVHAAALISQKGNVSIVIINDGAKPKEIILRGLSKSKLYHYWYDSTLPDGIQDGGLINSNSSVSIKPMSINAFTSWKWSSLKP
ncbi:MAG: hypothetical protein ACYC0V_17060 [Armatimonadota bacterium]